MPDDLSIPPELLVEHTTSSESELHATTFCDSPAAALPASTVSRRYALGKEIARGGMGAVYRATDSAFGREVAVKVLLEAYAPNSRTARRFHDEALITGQLQHPGIPPVHDLGTLPDGRPFLAMKLIKGDTLDNQLKQQSAPFADCGGLIAVFESVCQAVAYAHAHNVIHRDLKPSNIMVGAFGEVQVMDWGLAKVLGDCRPPDDGEPDVTSAETLVGSARDSEEFLTQAGSVLGTPAYMPPEQAIGAVHEVDRRSDVFGLGGILAAILTGRPPFVGDTVEATRVMAARGEMLECFDRLEECEADPELVSLAKRCLAPKREDRPADAEAVAKEVGRLRAAADDRARQAEVELAATAAASAERQNRRRVWLGAAIVLTLTMVSGLGAIMAVQQRANAELKLKNEALVAERAKVEQRFDMARKAIASFHTTLEEQPELGNEVFRSLRTKLLGSAAEFYRELEDLLAEEPDRKSRAALAESFFQLAELTNKIGDLAQSAAIYRKALVLRQELTAGPGADREANLAVSLTLRRLGGTLLAIGDTEEALRVFERARDSAAALEDDGTTDMSRQALAASQFGIAVALSDMGQLVEALAAYESARALRQALVDAHPAIIKYQSELADCYNNIGNLLKKTGKPTEAMAAHQRARDLRQTLVDAQPGVTEYLSDLAQSNDNIGNLLNKAEQPADALAAHQRARDLRQGLADAHPAVNQFQSELADSHHNIGIVLDRMGLPAESLVAFEKARDLRQKLANDNPNVTINQSDLASSYTSIGIMQEQMGQSVQAVAAFRQAMKLRQKLADAHPDVSRYKSDLAKAEDNLSRFLAQDGRSGEEFAAQDSEQATHETLAAADAKIIKDTTSLGYSHAHRGRARVWAGRMREAAVDLRAAIELLGKSLPSEAKDRFERARSLALLAKLGADSNSGVTAEEAEGFAGQAVAALAEAFASGWSQSAELQEPDFDSLRERADFKKLQADLQAVAVAPR